MTKAEAKRAELEEDLEFLRKVLPPGSTVHTVLRHVSRSGMSRGIDLYLIRGGEPLWLSSRAAHVLGLKQRKDGSVGVGGCGMDMEFHLVYELSQALYPEGHGCVGKGCPSNDHANGDRSYEPHTPKKPHWHREGGYAVSHQWL